LIREKRDFSGKNNLPGRLQKKENLEDSAILSLFADKPKEGLSVLFDKYYEYLSGQVYYILNDVDESEDVIQELFMELWSKREHLVNINSSLKSYLKRAAINRALNKIKKRKNFYNYDEDLEIDRSVQQPNLAELSELEIVIEESIEELPPKCKEIFILSREEDKTYREISQQLDISIKTVENQIGKALKLLRKKILKK